MLVWADGAELRVQLVDTAGLALPLQNVILDINFYVSAVRRYSFSGGATDAEGICSIALDNVAEQWRANKRLFLMDYNTPLNHCDDKAGILAPSRAELVQRLASVQKWFPENLIEFTAKIRTSNNHLIESHEQTVEISPRLRIQNFRYVCARALSDDTGGQES